MEVKDQEVTLDDLYCLNLSKLDEWKCIIPVCSISMIFYLCLCDLFISILMDRKYFKHKTRLLANVDILFQKSSGAENSLKNKLCFNAVFYNGIFTFPI